MTRKSPTDGRGEHAARRIVEVGDVAHEVRHRLTREQRDAVVGLLAAEDAVISGGREFRVREVRVLHLGFLQRDDVRANSRAAIRAAARRARAGEFTFQVAIENSSSPLGHRRGGRVHWTRPCWRSSAFTSGGRPRKSTNASSAFFAAALRQDGVEEALRDVA